MRFFVPPTHILVRVVTLAVVIGVTRNAIAPAHAQILPLTATGTPEKGLSVERSTHSDHLCDTVPRGCGKGGSR